MHTCITHIYRIAHRQFPVYYGTEDNQDEMEMKFINAFVKLMLKKGELRDSVLKNLPQDCGKPVHTLSLSFFSFSLSFSDHECIHILTCIIVYIYPRIYPLFFLSLPAEPIPEDLCGDNREDAMKMLVGDIVFGHRVVVASAPDVVFEN